MEDNKDTYTYRKYSSNKNLAVGFRIFIFVDIVIGIYFLIIFYLSAGKIYPVGASLIALVLSIVFYREVLKADKEMRKIELHNYFTWGRGAGAELAVKRSLMRLSDEYRIINDFQAGGWNIDHICIGPTGIFAIETKSHKGLISYVDGKLKGNGKDLHNYLGQAKRGAVFLSQLIEKKTGKYHFVVPVLVFPHGEIDNSINHQIEGVWVGGRGFECWVVENCKDKIGVEEIESICSALKDYDPGRDKIA